MSEVGKKLFIGSISKIISIILQSIAGLLITMILTKNFTVEEFGVYKIISSSIVFILTVFSFGTHPILYRYLPKFIENKDYIYFKKTTIFILGIQLILSITIAALFFIFSDFIAVKLKIANIANISEYFILISIVLVIYYINGSSWHILSSLLLFKESEIITMVYNLFKLSAIFISVQLGYGFKGVIFSWFLSHILWGGLNYILVIIHMLKLPSENKKNFIDIKTMIKYGFFEFFSKIGKWFLDINIDIYIITIILGSSFVGYYALGWDLVSIIRGVLPGGLLIKMVGTVFIRQYTKNNDINQLESLLKLYFKFNLFFGIPMMIGSLILIDKVIVIMFTPDYLPAIKIFFIAMVGFIFFACIGSPLSLMLIIFEKANIMFLEKIFSIYNIIMNLILIYWFGVVGVALSTSSTLIFIVLFRLYFIRKNMKINFPVKELFIIILNCLPMIVYLIFIKNYCNSIISLISFITIGGIIYFVVCYFKKIFSDSERNLFNNAIGKKIFIF